MRTIFATAFLLLIHVAAAFGQTTTPYTTADRILWDAAGATDVADAQAAVYKVYASGSGVTQASAIVTHTCGAPAAPDVKASCQAQLPAAILPALNARTSIATVTAGANIPDTSGGTTLVESPQSLPFVAGRPYGAPGRPRLSR